MDKERPQFAIAEYRGDSYCVQHSITTLIVIE